MLPTPSTSETTTGYQTAEGADSADSPSGDAVSAAHRKMLIGSGISDKVIAERGYKTVATAKEAQELGFSAYQSRVPALLVPIHDVHGMKGNLQLRPDVPRLKAGKAVEYETRPGSPVVIDVPPGIRRGLAEPKTELWITNGATNADAAVSAGIICISMAGVWNWRETSESGGKTALPDWDFIRLAERDVLIAFDSDSRKDRSVQLAEYRLARLLASRGAVVRIVRIPSGHNGENVGLGDFIARGGSFGELRDSARPVSPLSARRGMADGKPSPPRDIVYRGIAGEFVRTVSPHSEADPVALLIGFLVAFGNAVGRGPHALVTTTRHGTNIFAVLVGRTSKARKGDSWNPVAALFRMADDAWDSRVDNGLTSGEGLIHAVRDNDGGRSTGTPKGPASSTNDPGVADKRRMVVEPELARVLHVMDRQGNTLSAVLRDAWDGRNLQVLTKNSPSRATDPHISLMAHVTLEELRECLRSTDVANGFANRMMFFVVERSKLLPSPMALGDEQLKGLATELGSTLEKASHPIRLERSAAANARWAEMYSEMADERPGVVGALAARGEAQVLRLSLIYALMDGATEVSVEHLEAAYELWKYSEASLEHVFGGFSEDPTEARILDALADRDLSRTGIRDLLGRNMAPGRIEATLDRLLAEGVIVKEERATAGRPATWYMMSG